MDFDLLVPKVGRRPKRVPPDDDSTFTMKIPGVIKNLMIDQAEAYDMTVTEYLVTLVERDAAGSSQG